MAVMTGEEKRQALRAFGLHPHAEDITVTKPEIRAAIDAVDLFMDSQAANIRNQIDPATRAKLSSNQTRVLIRAIMQARYG